MPLIKPNQPKSLSQTFNTLVIVLILGTSLIITLVNTYQNIAVNYQRLYQNAQVTAEMLAMNSEYALFSKNLAELHVIADKLNGLGDIAYIEFYDAQGILLHAHRYSNAKADPKLTPLSDDQPVPDIIEILFDSSPHAELNFTRRIFSQKQSLDDAVLMDPNDPRRRNEYIGYLRYGLFLRPFFQDIRRSIINASLASIGISVLGILVMIRTVRRITRPLNQLAVVSRSIAEGPFDRQLSLRGGREINELVDAFNVMIRRLGLYRVREQKRHEELQTEVKQRTRELELATENALRLTEKAEAANRAKSQFLANMSHEIRTPMNAIMGFTELLLKGTLTAQQNRYLQLIFSSSKVLLDLINDILDFSRIEAGKLAIHNEWFNPYTLLEHVIDLFGAQTAAKRIDLCLEVLPGMPERLSGDQTHLQQILVNLLGNAVKFTSQGEIVLRAALIEDWSNSVRLLVAVQDTGIGIAEDKLADIFCPFAQADQSSSRLYGGSGLGLSITRQLAEMMGGTVTVTSQVGVGSTFTVQLVLGKAPDSPGTLPQPWSGRRYGLLTQAPTRGNILAEQIRAWGGECLMIDSLEQLAVTALEELAAMVVDHTFGDAAQWLIDHPPATGVTLIDWSGEPRGLAEWRHLNQPYHLQDLFDCLDGRASEASAQIKGCLASVYAGFTDISILVVEDNPVNRELAQDMLAVMGCRVTVCDDGGQALVWHARHHFDLIFMDCQMPVMDGYQATQAIRDAERQQSLARVPIVALTAEAISGEKNHCLAVGMDDFVTKPFVQQDLINILNYWLPHKRQQISDAPAAAVADTDAELDDSALQRICSLDQENPRQILGKIVDLYVESAPQLVAGLLDAAVQGDRNGLRRLAHSLKSSSANLGAEQLADYCKQLELQAATLGVDELQSLVERIRDEAPRVYRALRQRLA